MNLEERMNALFAWMDEPASAGLQSAAAIRVLGDQNARKLEKEAREAVPEDREEADRAPQTGPQDGGADTGSGKMPSGQAAYDIAGLWEMHFPGRAPAGPAAGWLPRTQTHRQSQNAASMSPGELDLLLRTKWRTLPDEQRAEMLALQQCGLVPDGQMDLFLYALSVISEPASEEEIKRLLTKLRPRAERDEAWIALADGLRARMDAAQKMTEERIRQLQERVAEREEAYRRASEAYEQAQAARIAAQNAQ